MPEFEGKGYAFESARAVMRRYSPLYHVRRGMPPVLLIHGTGDTNVVPTESEQMFTALRMLGRQAGLQPVPQAQRDVGVLGPFLPAEHFLVGLERPVELSLLLELGGLLLQRREVGHLRVRAP